jgi:hypothetical protein
MDVFNRFLQTTGLTRAQWGVCLIVPISVVLLSELWKWYLRSRTPVRHPETGAAAAPESAPSAV